jgi:hypothetical protein
MKGIGVAERTAEHVIAEPAHKGLAATAAGERVIARGAEIGDRLGEIAAIDDGRLAGLVDTDDKVRESIAIDIASLADAVAAGNPEALIVGQASQVDVGEAALLSIDDECAVDDQIIDSVAIDVARLSEARSISADPAALP